MHNREYRSMSQIKSYSGVNKVGKDLDHSLSKTGGIQLTGKSKIVMIEESTTNDMSSTNINMVGRRRIHEDGELGFTKKVDNKEAVF